MIHVGMAQQQRHFALTTAKGALHQVIAQRTKATPSV
jgi:hypothetical protein